MQTEAAPKESFTLGVLLRYKTTIFVVATLVLLGGYIRIVTQQPIYEATARLAVRFTSEALALQEVSGRGSLFRLPLLEEEVKAYMVQITDPKFIDEVLRQISKSDEEGVIDEPVTPDQGAVGGVTKSLMRAYNEVRRSILTLLDTLLLTPDDMLSPQQQAVMRVISKLTVTTGTEASHIISVTFKDAKANVSAKVVNAIAREFIKQQKKRVQRIDMARVQKAVEDAQKTLVENKVRLYELMYKLGSPTVEESIRTRYEEVRVLEDELNRTQMAKRMLDKNLLAFNADMPMGSRYIMGELESALFMNLSRLAEQAKRSPEEKTYYADLKSDIIKLLEERKAAQRESDKVVVEQRLEQLQAQRLVLVDSKAFTAVVQELSTVLAQDTGLQARVAQAEAELVSARSFNEQLENDNVSENITLWQPAQVPPFPLPQHRGVKLIVIVALSIFAGLVAALVQHHIRPKRARRARPRQGEVSVPIILMPEDGKREPARRIPEVDIALPPEEGAQKR